ncbi:MAG: hypothetical protein R2685_06305 [Candidatus Nitrosocosmicus sp.]|nr:hypothetical protein [Candidatus Nitrosocosmicus sp.]
MSDFTDRVDDDRRKEIHWNTFVASSKEELKGFEGRKKEIVLEGKNILEERGYDKEKISTTLGDVFEGYISRQYIRRVLGDEYKEISKRNINKELCETVSHQEKKPLLVTNNGETEAIDQNAENTLDEIYGGKSFSQMKREADYEIDEEMEKTLVNPRNLIPDSLSDNNITTQSMPLLSDKSPEYREMEVRVKEQEKIIEEQNRRITKKDQDFFNLKRSYIQSRGETKDQEITQLKKKVTDYETQLLQIDRESLAKEGYKEIEILKLHQDTIRMMQEVSGKSERTFFLLVHPKTMLIKAAKTDKDMHQIQAKRAAGV